MQELTFTVASSDAVPPLVVYNIRGVRRSSVFEQGMGLQGREYVYVAVRHGADQRLPTIPLKTRGRPLRGSLVIQGDLYKNHTFHVMDLVTVMPVVTGRERLLVLEFRAPRDVTDDPARYKRPILELYPQAPPEDGPLGDDYKYATGDAPLENLLGFSMIGSVAMATPVRLSALTTDPEHSFSELLSRVHENWLAGRGAGRMKPFTVKFSQGDLKLTADNLDRLYVEESSGVMLEFAPPTLGELIADGGKQKDFARFTPPAYSGETLLLHNKNREFPDDAGHRIVQHATFIFAPGKVPDLTVA